MENLLDKITMDEWKMIDTYRRDYVDAAYTTTTMTPSKQVLQIWSDSKQDLYKLLGNNLIVSNEFNYSKSQDLMLEELEELFEGWKTCGREERTGKEFWRAIHPLDYMTMSDNECGWHSCMSWEDEGCYRQGTVEMMNSPCVVVAYISDKNTMPIGNDGEWNNKRWRQLFIVNKDVIFSIKSYPYADNNITEYVMNWLKTLAEKNMGWSYGQETPIHWTYNDQLIAGDQPFKISFHTNLMYNDVGSISYHHMYYNNTKVMPNGYIIDYSGDSQCMWCGSIDGLYEDSLACDSCSGMSICSDCGERICEDEIYYIGDDKYCKSCYREYMSVCDFCNDDFPNKEVFNIVPYINDPKDKDGIYLINIASTVCNDCFYNWLKENITEPSTKIYAFNDDSTEYLINITDITKNGVEDLLSWSIRYVYENTENIAEFIDKLQSRRYYSPYLNTRNNYTKISYEELLTKLEERI